MRSWIPVRPSCHCWVWCEGVTAGLVGKLEEDAVVLRVSLVLWSAVVLIWVFLQVLCSSSLVRVDDAWLCCSWVWNPGSGLGQHSFSILAKTGEVALYIGMWGTEKGVVPGLCGIWVQRLRSFCGSSVEMVILAFREVVLVFSVTLYIDVATRLCCALRLLVQQCEGTVGIWTPLFEISFF